LIDITNCPLHHPAIHAAIPKLKDKIIQCRIPSYNEKKKNGLLRYVQFVVERKTGLIQLTLVVNENKGLQPLIKELWEQGIWHSIWINIQPLAINRIFGDQWILSCGNKDLFEELGNNQICFHPACFGQAHLSLFDDMLQSFKNKILPNQRVVEFYAGVGVIGLTVAPQSQEVTCVEINPFAKPCFKKSTAHENVKFIEADTENALYLLDHADVVIVDPPRKGLELSFIQALSRSEAKQFIYMSCGPSSYQRDHDILLALGFDLVFIESYLLFPGTDHVELLGNYKKRSL